jgi:hypothetical protein
MGHGAWMEIAWGTWKMGEWGWTITPETLHVLVGYVSRVRTTQASGCSSKLDMFRWVVGFEVLASKLMYCNTQFSTDGNECRATIKTWHVFVSVCSKAPATRVWKHVLGHLEASDAFTTCCWNNVEAKHQWRCSYSLDTVQATFVFLVELFIYLLNSSLLVVSTCWINR